MDAGSAGRGHRACLGRLKSALRWALGLRHSDPDGSGAGGRRSSRGSRSRRGGRGFRSSRRGSALASRGSRSTAASRGRSTAASGNGAAATMTPVVTVPAMAAAAGRSTAAVTSAATAMAAVATVASHSGLLTAHQGDADDREKDRDTEDQNAIHPRPPTEKVPERKGPKFKNSHPVAVRLSLHPFATAPNKGGTGLCIRCRAVKTSRGMP